RIIVCRHESSRAVLMIGRVQDIHRSRLTGIRTCRLRSPSKKEGNFSISSCCNFSLALSYPITAIDDSKPPYKELALLFHGHTSPIHRSRGVIPHFLPTHCVSTKRNIFLSQELFVNQVSWRLVADKDQVDNVLFGKRRKTAAKP
ncbi:hypothetical protein JI435_408690, partial [Parastagonospora nodorum SN15]